MELDRISLTVINDIFVKGAEQDQTARMFRLISLNTFCEINAWARTAALSCADHVLRKFGLSLTHQRVLVWGDYSITR